MLHFKLNRSVKSISFIVVSTFLLCNLILYANNDSIGENVCDTLCTAEPSSDLISYAKNIVWTLESYEIAGQAIDLSSYPPFNLVYGDSVFFGDDGCNSYEGIYETNGDSIFPKDLGITALCGSNGFFSALHLGEPYRYKLHLENSELTLFHSDSIYTYRSDFLEDVDSLLIDKKWILTSDANVTLFFFEDRIFEANYDQKNSNIGSGTIGGIYGIGNNNTILFYDTESSGSGLQWYHYLKTILNSPSYIVENNLLILFSDSATFEFTCLSSIIEENIQIETPYNFKLFQNYPNPFNAKTTIHYTLKNDVKVHLTIFNLMGQEVRVLVNEIQSAGCNAVTWNGKDNYGEPLPSGIYIYNINAGKFNKTLKLLMLK